MNANQIYSDALAQCKQGVKIETRNGLVKAVFGYHAKLIGFKSKETGYKFMLPVTTLKRIALRHIFTEFAWVMQGNPSVKYLHSKGCKYWDQWADEDGKVGMIYGPRWRAWPTAEGKEIDQLDDLVENILKDPYSRRHILTTWSPEQDAILPPCLPLIQFTVRPAQSRPVLDMHVHQRSSDAFIGLPLDMTFLSLLLILMSRLTKKSPGHLHLTIANLHLYQVHNKAAAITLGRVGTPGLPQVKVEIPRGVTNFDDVWKLHDTWTNESGENEFDQHLFGFVNIGKYDPLPPIPMEVPA